MELIYSEVNGLLTNWFWNHRALNDCGQSWAFGFFFTLKRMKKKANHMIGQKKTPLRSFRTLSENMRIMSVTKMGNVIYSCNRFSPEFVFDINLADHYSTARNSTNLQNRLIPRGSRASLTTLIKKNPAQPGTSVSNSNCSILAKCSTSVQLFCGRGFSCDWAFF